MTIALLEIENFRNIESLKFRPFDINIIYGKSGIGKTTILDSIAYADSSDHEFQAMLRFSYGPEHAGSTLESLVRLNFFTHTPDLESFRVKVHFQEPDRRNRLLEIWKTDEGIHRMVTGKNVKPSPFLYVFDSIQPKQVLPHVIPHSRLNEAWKSMKVSQDNWPSHYLGPSEFCGLVKLQKQTEALKNNLVFGRVMTSFMKRFPEVIGYGFTNKSNSGGLLLKFADRIGYVPVYLCSYSMIRIMKMLMLLCCNTKGYLLIDDLERGLTDEQLGWLIPQVCNSARDLDVQLFISTSREDVRLSLEKMALATARSTKILDFTIVEEEEQPQHA